MSKTRLGVGALLSLNALFATAIGLGISTPSYAALTQAECGKMGGSWDGVGVKGAGICHFDVKGKALPGPGPQPVPITKAQCEALGGTFNAAGTRCHVKTQGLTAQNVPPAAKQ